LAAGHGEFRGLEFLEVRAPAVINLSPRSPACPSDTPSTLQGLLAPVPVLLRSTDSRILNLKRREDFTGASVVKVNAVERVRAEVQAKRWAGGAHRHGDDTDPYQRCEGKYRLTRGIVKVLGERRNPFLDPDEVDFDPADLDVLAEAAAGPRSTPPSRGTVDDEVWRISEPGRAASPKTPRGAS